jgi:hypothetical protein
MENYIGCPLYLKENSDEHKDLHKQWKDCLEDKMWYLMGWDDDSYTVTPKIGSNQFVTIEGKPEYLFENRGRKTSSELRKREDGPLIDEILLTEPLKITIGNTGEWGFWLPDVIKNEKVCLRLSNGIIIEIKDSDFYNILALIGDHVKESVKKCHGQIEKLDAFHAATAVFKKRLSTFGLTCQDGYAWLEDGAKVSSFEQEFEAYFSALNNGGKMLREYNMNLPSRE